jgi:hypothetical protein
MYHNPTDDDPVQYETTAATTNSDPDISRRTLLKAGTVAGGTLAISGCTTTGEARLDDEPSDDDTPGQTNGVDDIRVPRLHLDTLEAEVEGETLRAVSYEDWRPSSATYVGHVSGIRGPDLFVGVSRPGGDAEDDAELVVYLCNGEIGGVPTIRIYQTGDYDTSGVTLTEENVSSADGHIETKLALVGGTFLGSLSLADGEPFPFIAHEATGDAGLYKAETEAGDLVAHWIVFPDGRQRGGMAMDGKGNDVYGGGSFRKFCVFNYCIYY